MGLGAYKKCQSKRKAGQTTPDKMAPMKKQTPGDVDGDDDAAVKTTKTTSTKDHRYAPRQ